MSIYQKLADIHMLVDYIKEHTDADTHAQLNTQVDTIGATAITIADGLERLTQQMQNGQDETFTKYKELAEELATNLCAKLQTISESIKQQQEQTVNTLDAISEIHSTYVGVLAENTTRFDNQAAQYNTDIETIDTKLSDITDIVSATKEKVISKEALTALLKDIESQIETMEENDTLFYELYEQQLELQNQGFHEINDSFQTLDADIRTINESFKTAVGRLDIILMKLDMLTGGVTHEK